MKYKKKIKTHQTKCLKRFFLTNKNCYRKMLLSVFSFVHFDRLKVYNKPHAPLHHLQKSLKYVDVLKEK